MMPANGQSKVSWFCRQRASHKLLFLLIISSFLLSIQTVWIQLGGVVGVSVLLFSAGLINRRFWQAVRSFFGLIVLIFAYSAWLQGWEPAAVTALRMISLLLLALAVSWTTSVSALMEVVEACLKPLDRLGWVKHAEITLTFGLTLRMIPELSSQWHEIREAQIARGLDRHVLICIVPMIVRTLKRAQDIADAIDVRQLNR